MVSEIEEGVGGPAVRAGIIKLAPSSGELTPGEVKAFRAGVKAQRRTGLVITTHAQGLGAAEAQLDVMEAAGAGALRVILGHTAPHAVEIPSVVRGLI